MRKTPPEGTDFALKELMAVREIAHAFLTADRPEELYQFTLERVSPLVGASFASVYLVDGASELMRLGAEFKWPARYRPWLGEMRVRVGFGPSGEAVSERRAIEIPDVFADQSLEDWQEVANELGFRSFVALPLMTARGVLGAVTFYFVEAGAIGGDKRGLLRIVSDQLAAAAEKATLIEELRRTNAALQETNAELEKQYVEVVEAKRVKDEFLANISHELRTPLTAVMGYISNIQDGISGPLTEEQSQDLATVQKASGRLLDLIDNLLELTTLKHGGMSVSVSDFGPLDPLRDAIEHTETTSTGVEFRLEQPGGPLPTMRSDRRKLTRILVSLLSNAHKFTKSGSITASVSSSGKRISYRVCDTGIGIPEDARDQIFDEFRQLDGSSTRRHGGTGLGLALARRYARLLGGDISFVSSPGEGSTFTVDLPFEIEGSAQTPMSIAAVERSTPLR